MSKIVGLKDRVDETVVSSLKEMSDRAEHFSSVMIIALHKDGSQHLRVSSASMQEKSYMVMFAHSYLMDRMQMEDA